MGPGDIIGLLSFLLSAYAVWVTLRFNSRQKSLIESQEKLNLLLLEKEQNDAIDEKKADLGASFITLGSNKHRLKVWNKGKAPARNVRIEFPEGNSIVHDSDVESMFPLEVLERYQSVELIAVVHMRMRRKLAVKLIWADDYQSHNEKTVYPTL